MELAAEFAMPAIGRFQKTHLSSCSIIDTEEQIARLLPHLDAMVEDGLVATSIVEVVCYSRHDDEAAPQSAPGH